MILAQHVAGLTGMGWRVESQTPISATLVIGRRPNHVLHALLTIFTCFMWGFMWIILGVTQREQRISLLVDDFGNVTRR